MNNTIMSSKNTFEGGLLMDFAPDNMSSNVMTSALNATLLTFNGNEMLLQNDMGNGRVETARLPDGYIPVGSCEFGDIIYIVSYNPILNKSQVGCFPSPERNISSEEIGDMKLTLSWTEFLESNDGLPTGKLKAASIKKILYDSKNMNSGDKYIIYSKDLHNVSQNPPDRNSIYLSDFGNPYHQNESFPKFIKIHVVSIEESGKIVYLDSTTKWYDNDYYINTDMNNTDNSKPDLDAYRSLVSSAYSVFSSKVSGKLALLIELEKITGFSCSWEPYINKVYEEDDIEYTEYLIHWDFNWITKDNNINPNGALLLESNWVNGEGNAKLLKNTNEILEQYSKAVECPTVVTNLGPSILFNRKYQPEKLGITYSDFKNVEYQKLIEDLITNVENGVSIKNPYKIDVRIDPLTGFPTNEYYINSVKADYGYALHEQPTDLKVPENLKVEAIVVHNDKLGVVGLYGPSETRNLYYDGKVYSFVENGQNKSFSGIGATANGISAIIDGKLVNFDSDLNPIEVENNNINYENTKYFDIEYNGMYNVQYVTNESEFIIYSGDNDYHTSSLPCGITRYYKSSLLVAKENKLYEYKITSKGLALENTFTLANNILSFDVENEIIYILFENTNDIKAYKLKTDDKVYYINDEGEEEEQLSRILSDDIVNNYFNYPVIKPFTVIEKDKNENWVLNDFIFKIPTSLNLKEKNLKVNPDLSELLYHYKFAPTMPYGYLEEYAQDGVIDFSKIGKKDITLNTWKYYNYENTSTLTWGLDAYVEPGKGISEVVFEFYDNQGIAAAYHIKNKRSYNGKFTEYLTLNSNQSGKKLNNIDHNNKIFRHKGREVSSIADKIDGKMYTSVEDGINWEDNITDGTVYYEDDAGTLYSNCLYLVKIIIKYCNKGSIGNYIESGLEYVYDYRWYWTNNMFNDYYYNTTDYNELLFKLNLNCFTHLYPADNYKVNQHHYYPGEINESVSQTDICRTLSANIQHINIDGKSGESNIKLSLTPGLLNDYNMFNLKSKVENGKLTITDFVTNIYLGDEFVNNIKELPQLLYTESEIAVDLKYLQPISEFVKLDTNSNTNNDSGNNDGDSGNDSGNVPGNTANLINIIYEESENKVTITHLEKDARVYYSINHEGGGGISYSSKSNETTVLLDKHAWEVISIDVDLIKNEKTISQTTWYNPKFQSAESPQLAYSLRGDDPFENNDTDKDIGDTSPGDSTPRENWIFAPTDQEYNTGGGADSTKAPIIHIYIKKINDTIEITTKPKEASELKITYTLDGNPATSESEVYSEPINLTQKIEENPNLNLPSITVKVRAEAKGYQISYDEETFELKPQEDSSELTPYYGKIIKGEVSKDLHTLLNTNYSGPTNADMWTENFNKYTNKFLLEFGGKSNISKDTFYYLSSDGQYKSVLGCPKLKIEDLADVLFDNNGFISLTLSGIHYSKYAYTTKQETITKKIRSFVVTENDLEKYHIRTYTDGDNLIPYSSTSLAILSSDTGADETAFCWSVHDLTYNSGNYTNVTLSRDYTELDLETSITQRELLDYGNLDSDNFSFILPVHFMWDKDHSSELYNDSHISKEGSNDIIGKSCASDTSPISKELTNGTLAIIKDNTIEIANHYTTMKANTYEGWKDIFKECARIALGYTSLLFYLSECRELGRHIPSNYIYLEPNTFSYKRDIIIAISPLKYPDEKNFNKLILMHLMDFEKYVGNIIKNSKIDGNLKSGIEDSPNINLVIDDFVQTAPLEYQANYIKPDVFSAQNKICVETALTNVPEYYDDILSPNQVYAWDNTTKTFNTVGSIKQLHYINSFKRGNGKLEIDISETGENKDTFSLGSVNTGLCLGITNDKLVFKSIPSVLGTYSLNFWPEDNEEASTDSDDTVTGFKNFKIYE